MIFQNPTITVTCSFEIGLPGIITDAQYPKNEVDKTFKKLITDIKLGLF